MTTAFTGTEYRRSTDEAAANAQTHLRLAMEYAYDLYEESDEAERRVLDRMHVRSMGRAEGILDTLSPIGDDSDHDEFVRLAKVQALASLVKRGEFDRTSGIDYVCIRVGLSDRDLREALFA